MKSIEFEKGEYSLGRYGNWTDIYAFGGRVRVCDEAYSVVDNFWDHLMRWNRFLKWPMIDLFRDEIIKRNERNKGR